MKQLLSNLEFVHTTSAKQTTAFENYFDGFIFIYKDKLHNKTKKITEPMNKTSFD